MATGRRNNFECTRLSQMVGDPTTQSFEPSVPVLGVTVYERVTAFMLTLIVTLGAVTVVFGALWVADHLSHREPESIKIALQPFIPDDDEDFGGIPTGAVNDTDPSLP